MEQFPLLRPDLQVIGEDDRLCIKIEMRVIWIAFHQVQQRVHDMHQADTKLLEGGIPFPVPVRVGDDEDSKFIDL